MKLSIVILNYNVRYFLELCLKSVQAAITNIDAEIIVVDNNSEDDSCRMVKQLFPNVNLIENKENHGFSKGNNIGVNQAQGEYLCILNPDTVVAEDTFEKLLQFCEGRENLGAVGCKLIDGTGRFLPESKRNIPVVKTALKKFLGNSKHYYANHLGKDETGKVEILVGAFMFLKRALYSEVSGFDEDYFMYGEDIDLSYKIRKKGLQNYYYGETTVLHYKGESTLKDKKYAKRFYGAMQIFYKKHFKRNILFDMLVALGIKIIPFLKRSEQKQNIEPSQYVLVSDNVNDRLASRLDKSLVVNRNIDNIESGNEIIFDSNVLTFKEIMALIEKYSNSKRCTFKILPKRSNFILGSNSASGRGEIIVF
ncbi:glycosyltransferase family 2 protein [Hyunsoonleella flava]|uniref:Glycosyltransferase family 2 protein n=1 Tax=Hyunsoonleella flava TaxID=2527939 RepID=A0A4Q9FGA9_9FLAO|nr:glycosyltransferase family 2 protein [Hyunsoonleella flava]TBN04870.1 glycosyltransferase family 2 protein [Hyunsoonleella flava]